MRRRHPGCSRPRVGRGLRHVILQLIKSKHCDTNDLFFITRSIEIRNREPSIILYISSRPAGSGCERAAGVCFISQHSVVRPNYYSGWDYFLQAICEDFGKVAHIHLHSLHVMLNPARVHPPGRIQHNICQEIVLPPRSGNDRPRGAG